MSVTKGGLPRKAYAYATSADPADWLMPYLDASGRPDPAALASAAQTITEAAIPAEYIGMVKSKLRQAYRRMQGSDVSYPESIREVDPGLASYFDGAVVRENAMDVHEADAEKTDGMVPCPTCKGTGKILGGNVTCPECDGKKVVTEARAKDMAEAKPKAKAKFNFKAKEGVGYTPTCFNCGDDGDCECTTCPCDGDAHVSSPVGDLSDALGVIDGMLNVQAQLYELVDDEKDEPDQVADILRAVTASDVLIDAVRAFMRKEAAEIGQPDGDEEVQEAYPVAEAGRMISAANLGRIQAMHDHAHETDATAHRLGAVHAGEGPGLGSDGSSKSEWVAAQNGGGIPTLATKVIEAVVDAEASATDIRIHEASGTSPMVYTLAEASPMFDDTTHEVTITPIRPGFGNPRDGLFYPEETLREAVSAGRFNGVKMFRNHPSKSEEKERPERDVRDWFATMREAWWDTKRNEPRARVRVFEDADWERFKAAPEDIAFSVIGKGNGRPGRIGSREAKVVESFTKVNSVDWVTQAGAGGAIAFAESAASEEWDVDLQQLTEEQLREANPVLYQHLVGIGKALAADDAEAKKAEREAAAAVKAKDGEGATETKEADGEKVEEVETTEAKLVRLAEYERRDQEVTAKEAAATIVKEVVGATTLPGAAKDAVAIRFAEASLGGGFIYTDEAVLRGALGREIASAEQMVKALSGKLVRGMGGVAASPESGETTVREAVEGRLNDKWGDDRIPKADATVYKPDEEVASRESDAGEPAVVSAASQPVFDRMASKW